MRAWLVLLAPLLMAQAKPVLVPDVSQRNIEIAYSFTGAELLLFGAILYPGGRLPTGEQPTDIVVVVKGPTQSILMREKEKVAGIWVNASRLRYRSAPSFYAIASSKPIARLVDDRTRAIYELGLDSLQLSPASSAPADTQDRFQKGLVDLKRNAGLYYEAPRAVEITDGVLYRARVSIPARVPVGRFTAETFLIRDGRVLAAAVREVLPMLPIDAAPGLPRPLLGFVALQDRPVPVLAPELLLDPQALMSIIPGAHGVEKVSDSEFRADVTLGIGPVKGRYSAAISLSDLNEPESVTLSGGTEGALGSGHGSGRVTLTEDGGRTTIAYTYEAAVGGKVASIGGRLLDGAARVVIGQFFDALAHKASGKTGSRIRLPAAFKRLLAMIGVGA